jgi:aminopeptidase C
VKNFEFSQAHTFFYEKLERANFFLECVSQFPAGTDPSDRELAHLLSNPTEDGGQWNMAVNIIEKYGAVPKDCYPESTASQASLMMNRVLGAWGRVCSFPFFFFFYFFYFFYFSRSVGGVVLCSYRFTRSSP